MSYIGNTNTTQGFIPAVDYFSGNGSTVAFTLSRPVASVAQVQANISNVPQNPSSAFSVSGNTITFTSAPPSGTNNIYVYYTSPITQVIAPGQGTVTSSSFGTVTDFTTTGNTVLGDASTDTLNVGNGGLVKDASGNVGIGTSSPGERLDVQGSSSPTIKVRNTSAVLNNYSQLYLDTNNTFSGTGASFVRSISLNAGNSSTALAFGTNADGGGAPTERMRIDSSGNLLVGGQTSSITPYALLQVRGDNKGISIQDTTDNSYRAIYNQSGSLYFYNGSNEGYLSTAGAWINASDAKLKNSIVDIKHGLSSVLNTKPRSYKMNGLDGDYIGFVAQELQPVIPEVVSQSDKQLGVDYGSLVAVAFKAIQEQQAIIQTLTDRITALENK